MSLTESEAAIVYTNALMVLDKLETYIDECGDRRYGQSLPTAVLCWGEAQLLLPALAVFAALAFPSLTDPETLESLIRNASAADAKGRPN